MSRHEQWAEGDNTWAMSSKRWAMKPNLANIYGHRVHALNLDLIWLESVK